MADGAVVFMTDSVEAGNRRAGAVRRNPPGGDLHTTAWLGESLWIVGSSRYEGDERRRLKSS